MTGYESKRAAARDKLDGMEREALKLALEALNIQSDRVTEIRKRREAITAIKEALAKPAQEPVAWVQDVEFEQLPEFAFSWVKTRLHDKPLYTTPPQRPWVGLTDEEAQWLYDNCRTPSNLIDMVEAKLKDKNT